MRKLRESLQAKITAIFGLIVLAGCLILGLVSYNRAAALLREEACNALLVTAKQAAETVDTLIQSRIVIVECLAARNIIRGKSGDRAATLEEKLQALREEEERLRDQGYNQFGIADRQGNIFFPNGTSSNIADREYFKEALSGKTVVSSTIVHKINKSVVIVYATPVRDYYTNAITGVLIGVVDATRLNQMVSSVNYGKTGYGFAVDSAGTIIAHPDAEQVINRTNFIEAAKSDPSLSELAATIAKMAQGETGISQYTYKGVSKFVGYAPIKSAGWSIGINVPVEEVLAKTATLKRALVIASLLIVILALAVTAFMARNISVPIIDLTGILNRLAGYDFTFDEKHRATGYLKRKDEIGQMTNALATMQTNIVSLVKDLKAQAQTLVGSSETLGAASEEIASSSNEVARAIEQVASGAGEQASNLQDILQLMNDIASNLDRVYSQLNTVKQNSDNTSQLADLGKKELDILVGSIEEVREAFRSVAERLKALNSSVNQVGEILDVINSIAEQTNLLALNAAIEAARAGEAGRGFAVVAEEVRKLAEESKASSDKISALLNVIIAETTEVVGTSEEAGKQVASQIEKVGDTLKSFDDILGSVASIAPAVEATFREVASTVKAKDVVLERLQAISAVSEETSASAEEISASAEELTASTEEIAANAQEVLTVAKHLEEATGKFKL